jgi:Trk-type K+ transport system membrane component
MTKVNIYQRIRSKWKRKRTKRIKGNMKAITMPNIPAYLSNEVILDTRINDLNQTKGGNCWNLPFSQLTQTKTKKPSVAFFKEKLFVKKPLNLSNSFFCDEEGNNHVNNEKPNLNDYRLLFLEKFNCVQRAITGYGSYFFFHLLYIICIVIISATIIFFVEKSQLNYIDTLFMTASACSMTGLSSINTASLSLTSIWTLLVVMILGNNVLLSNVPLIIRRYFYQQWAKKVLNTFSLNSSYEKLNVNALLNREVVEYRALSCLLKYSLCYCFLVPFFSTFFIYIYLIGIEKNGFNELIKAKENNLIISSNKLFFAFFHSVSAFSNCGFGTHEQNLLPFASHYGVLLPLSFSILLGNTFYPIAIYFYVKMMHRIHQQGDIIVLKKKKKKSSVYHENTLHSVNYTLSYSKTAATQFLLDNPRRCYTHMFSQSQTFSLLCVASFLLLSQISAFIYLDLNRSYLSKYSIANRLLIAWFQNVSTRTAGFSCIDVTQSSEAMKLLWVFFMYIVSYPFILAVRTSTIEVAPTCHCSGSVHQASFKCVLLKLTRNLRYYVNPHYLYEKIYNSNISFFFSRYLFKKRKNAISNVNLFRDAFTANPITNKSKGESLNTCQNFHTVKQTPSRFSHDIHKNQCEETLSLTKSTGHTVLHRDSSFSQNLSYVENPSVEISSDIFAHRMYRVLIQDIFWLFLATVSIAVLEDDQFQIIPRLNIFSIIFETVSAYGTVGLSLGANDINAVSLSGLLSKMSKFIIIIVMIMGRHRSLPFAIDRAVNLPNLLHMATALSIHKPLTDQPCSHQINLPIHSTSNNKPYPKKIHHSF